MEIEDIALEKADEYCLCSIDPEENYLAHAYYEGFMAGYEYKNPNVDWTWFHVTISIFWLIMALIYFLT